MMDLLDTWGLFPALREAALRRHGPGCSWWYSKPIWRDARARGDEWTCVLCGKAIAKVAAWAANHPMAPDVMIEHGERHLAEMGLLDQHRAALLLRGAR